MLCCIAASFRRNRFEAAPHGVLSNVLRQSCARGREKRGIK